MRFTAITVTRAEPEGLCLFISLINVNCYGKKGEGGRREQGKKGVGGR